MKVVIVLLATVVAMVAAECDSKNYKKIGCFGIVEQAPDTFEEVAETDEKFNIDNYKDVLPKLVCDCLELTKDKYKYFSIGHNGHCHGSMSFHGNRPNNEAGCINSGEHSAGMDDHEYVYQIKADAATPIDGGVSDFGPWGKCSKTCGGGRRSRERACNRPLPNDPGQGCEDLTEVEDCNVQPCPINGLWSEWSEFESCSAKCGPGSQQRARKCDHPKPQHGGDECEGENTESKSCNLKPCPIDGGWGLWSKYTTCSKSCGKGTQERSRQCNHPEPQHEGDDCQGKALQSRNCVLKNCVTDASSTKCEGEKVEISCPENWTLKIKSSSFYGRKDGDTCSAFYNIHWSKNCGEGTTSKMSTHCDGKKSCEFECDNDVFGDPCKFTAKYCKVDYQCIGYDL